MTRKWLAVVLAIAMLLSMMPMGLAEDILESDAIEEIVEEPVEIVEEPVEDEEIVEADGTYIMTINKNYFAVQATMSDTATINFPSTGYLAIVRTDGYTEPMVADGNGFSISNTSGSTTIPAVSNVTATTGYKVSKGDMTFKLTATSTLGVGKYNLYYLAQEDATSATKSDMDLAICQLTSISVNVSASGSKLSSLVATNMDKSEEYAAHDGYKFTSKKTLNLYVGTTIKVLVTANVDANIELQFADTSYASATKVEEESTTKKAVFAVTGLKPGSVSFRAKATPATGDPLSTDIETAEVKVSDSNVPTTVSISPEEIQLAVNDTAYMEALVKGINAFGEQINIGNSGLGILTWQVNGTAYNDDSVKELIEISFVNENSHAIKVKPLKTGIYYLTATTVNGKSASAAVSVVDATIEIARIYTNTVATTDDEKKTLNVSLAKGKSLDLNQYPTFWYDVENGIATKQDKTNAHPVTWSIDPAVTGATIKDGVLTLASSITGVSVTAVVTLDSNVAIKAKVVVNVTTAADNAKVRSMAVYTGSQPAIDKNNIYGIAVASGVDAEASENVEPDANGTTVKAGYTSAGTVTDEAKAYCTSLDAAPALKIVAGKNEKLNVLYSSASRYVTTYDAGGSTWTAFGTEKKGFVTLAGSVSQPSTSWTLVRPSAADQSLKDTKYSISDYATVDQNGVVTVKQVFPVQATDYLLLKVTDTANTYLTCYVKIMSDYSSVTPTDKPYVAMTGFDTDFVLNEKGLVEVGLGETLYGGIVVEPANATGSFKYELKEVTTKKEFADLSQPDGESKPDLTILGLEVGYPEIWQIKVTQTDGDKVVTKSAYFKMSTVEDEPVDYTFDIEDDEVIIDLADGDTWQLLFADDSDVQDWAEVEWVNEDQFSDYFIIDETGEIYAYAVTPDDGIAAEAEVARDGGAIKDDVVNVIVIDTTVEPTEEPLPLKFSILEDTVELEPYDDAYLTLNGDIDNWDDVEWVNEDEFEEYFYILDGRVIAIAETPDEGITAVADCSAAVLEYSVDTVTIIVKKAFVPTATPIVIIPTEKPTEAPTTAPTVAPTVAPTAAPTDAPIMHQIAYVNGSSVNLRADATSSSASVAKLRKGTMVEVIEEGDAWTYVYTIEGYGFISNSLLTVPEFGEYSDNGYYVTASSLNIRVAPNGDKLAISPLANGVYVTVIGGVVDGWMLVDYMGYEGYVSAQYLAIIA